MSDKNDKKKKSFKGIAVFEFIVILGLGGFLGWDMLIRDRDSSDTKTVAVSGKSSAVSEDPQPRTRAVIEKEQTFYQLDGKKILYKDNALGEVYLPVFADVPASSLNKEQLITRNNYSFYKENGSITSIAGVDVSEYQGDIDWEKVKAAGIDFAIIRVGFRTYGGGEIQLDTKYVQNIEGALSAGIKVGAYFFSQAVSTEEAVAEADAIIDALEPYDISYPVVFDWEMIYGENARTDTVGVETLADCCIAFCERVRSAGYKPMIYSNKNTSLMKLDLPRIKDYDFWLAEYNTEPTYYYDFDIWQYASDGYIPGISGEVDMNISFRDFSKAETDKPAETATTATTTSAETTSGSKSTTTKAMTVTLPANEKTTEKEAAL